MLTKSERTRDFILETVAPIFNKMGYAATAMSDITDATGLTKGAIYGHFDHKKDLAIAAFKVNVKRMLEKVPLYTLHKKKAVFKKYSRSTISASEPPAGK